MKYEIFLGESTDGFHFVLSENGNGYVFNLACQFLRQEPFGCMDLRSIQPIDVISVLECDKSIDIAVIKDGIMTRYDTDKTRSDILSNITRVFGAKIILNRKGIAHSKNFTQNIITFTKGTLDMKGVTNLI